MENNQQQGPSKEFRAILSAAQSIAIAEGISDETLMIDRINEIAQDAAKEQPETEEGKKARANAAEMLNNSELVESPYKSKFNYSQYQDETVLPAMAETIKLMAVHADELVNFAKTSNITKEQVQANEDAFEAVSIGMFKILNDHKVPMPKYEFFFSKMRDIISFMEKIQVTQVTGHRHEVLSRTFGAINPGTGKFDGGYATYADLLEARSKIKEQTDGPNGEDRFSVKRDTELEDLS